MRRILPGLLFVPLLFLAGCGSDDGDRGESIVARPADNVVPMVVDQGPEGLTNLSVNIPFVSVTVCVPGTTQCQTIDHVQVDTGSYGLRVISSLLTAPSPAGFPAAVTTGGQALVQCTQFADGFVWGPVVTADVTIGAETAPNVPIQIMGGSPYPVPADCSGNAAGAEEDTVPLFGANAILGVGLFAEDCGEYCVSNVQQTPYYGCSAEGCTPVTVPIAQQVTNPVALFPVDNNGVILQLPAVGPNGSDNVTGALVFGIGTQSNNGLPEGAVVLPADPTDGTISTLYNGQTYSQSVIDSGSNAIYFNDSSIPTCPSTSIAPGFFCPENPLSLTATNTGTAGQPSSPVGFSIASADQLLEGNPTPTALNNVGAPLGNNAGPGFDWGLPFFYGRDVYFAIEGRNTSGGVGPYYAY